MMKSSAITPTPIVTGADLLPAIVPFESLAAERISLFAPILTLSISPQFVNTDSLPTYPLRRLLFSEVLEREGYLLESISERI